MALPFKNPCWNTADDPSGNPKKEDGGLPCAFCPSDISNRILKTNISVANEFCEIDAFEDSLSVDLAIQQLRKAKTAGKNFYLAVGLHK